MERIVEVETLQAESESIDAAARTATTKESTSPTTAVDDQTPTSDTPASGVGGETPGPTPESQPVVAEQIVAPTPGPAPFVPDATRVPVPTVTPPVESATDEGLSLPLRQLELAVGALVLLLALVTLWVRMSGRRLI